VSGLSISQRQTVLSADPLAYRVPSGLKASAVTAPPFPVIVCEPDCCSPQASSLISPVEYPSRAQLPSWLVVIPVTAPANLTTSPLFQCSSTFQMEIVPVPTHSA